MKRLTPVKAIRKNCLECVGTSQEVRNCVSGKGDEEKGYTGCPLFEFRFGHNPACAGRGRARKRKIEAEIPSQMHPSAILQPFCEVKGGRRLISPTSCGELSPQVKNRLPRSLRGEREFGATTL